MKDTGSKKTTKRIAPTPKRILVVEDDRSLRDNMAKVIELGSFAVTTAENGIAALKAMEEETYHLVITDVAMPGMDGVELVAKLASLYPKVPVLVASGTRSYSTRFTKALTPNVRAFLLKPVSIEALIEAVLKSVGN